MIDDHGARGRHRFLNGRAASLADNQMIGAQKARQLIAPVHGLEFLCDRAANFFNGHF